MRQSLASQENVVRPNGLTLSLKQSAHARRFPGSVGVEWKLPNRGQEQLNLSALLSWSRTFFNPGVELVGRNRGDGAIAGSYCRQALNGDGMIAHDRNAGVRVQQVA
jgi:hypothetical protein